MASTMRLNAARPAAAPVARRRAAARGLTVRAAATGDIVDTAAAAGSFKTLLAAATAAGLVDTLKGAGPLTVFAPTDAAFAALPAGTVERLLKPENKEELVAILTFHVVKGKTMGRHVPNSPSIPTLCTWDVKMFVDTKTGGKGVTIVGSKEVGKQGLNAAIIGGKIVQTDIECTNGLIHVVDAVLIPFKPLPGDNGTGATGGTASAAN